MADIARTAKKNGALFIQPDGPNTQPLYAGCYDVDDITETFGSITLLYCIDPNGQFKVVGDTEEPPDVITFTLGTFSGKRKEALEKLNPNCPIPLYLLMRDCGKADLFDNWIRAAILDVRKVTSRTLAGWVKRSEDAEMMTTFEVSAAPPIIDAIRLTGFRASIAETEGLNDIAFCNEERCAGPCGGALDVCQEGFITSDSDGVGGLAEVWTTTNSATWTTTATQPFIADEDIVGSVCFPLDKDTTRLIVARGTASVVAAPAEIAYSDDNGATWINVSMSLDGGTTPGPNGQYTPNTHSLYALDRFNIWLTTQDGYVYYSNDAGSSWEVQEAGIITAGPINAIRFKDIEFGMFVGDTDIVGITADGGLTWTIATATGSGDDLLSISWNGLFWWVGTDGGSLFYSDDFATTWDARGAWTGQGAGDVTTIDFANIFIGMMAHNTGGAGYVLLTIDGGFSWGRMTMAANSGINDLYMCATDLAWVVGEVNALTGFVAKIQPSD